MRGVEGLSSTLKGKDGSSHRFQKPSGAPEAVSLEAQNSHQEAHHVSVGSSLRFFLLLLLPLFLSSAPLLRLSSSPLRGHLASALGHASDKAFRKGGHARGAKLAKNEFLRLHTVQLHSFDPFPVRSSVSSKQPCRGLFLLSATLRRSFPFSLLSNDRPTDTAQTGRPIVAAGLSFNLSIITASFDSLDHSMLRRRGDRQRIRRKDEGICSYNRRRIGRMKSQDSVSILS